MPPTILVLGSNEDVEDVDLYPVLEDQQIFSLGNQQIHTIFPFFSIFFFGGGGFYAPPAMKPLHISHKHSPLTYTDNLEQNV